MGRPGEERAFRLELKLLADVGLVGYPNAGKSTLISRISAAKPKIADYPFTTLEPNLGVVTVGEAPHEESFVVADVPGLIEGAHQGKGLGLQFLRHLERTRALAFLIDATGEHPAADLEILNQETTLYGGAFDTKPRVVVLTKADALPPELREGAADRLGIPGARVISAHSGEGLPALLETLWTLIAPADETPAAAREDAAHGG